MRCAIAAVLVIGLGLGVYGCTEAQRKATVDGATDGAAGSPVNPPPASQLDQFLLYLAAYAAGTSSKEGLKLLKGKIMKG